MPTLVLQTSRLPMILICTIYFHGLIIVLDASFTCKAGQRVGNGKEQCEQCRKGYYQPTENDSMRCQVCTKCRQGSEEKIPCTITANTICRCRKGFLPREEDSSTCKCDIGFGETMDSNTRNTVCRECEDGFFSSSFDSACKAWTKCKENKVRVNGSKTTDAGCHEPHEAHLLPVTTTPGLKAETTSLSTRHTSLPPEISTPTWFPHQKTTANHAPAESNRRKHVIGGVIAGVMVGLFILTAMAIRCKAKEDPEYKRPIKETQQAKLHVIDIL